jgi:transposase
MLLTQDRDPATPRVLGMDDWAWRKGQRYGTILCDLEKHCVVDLLPDRQSNTVTAWLRDHDPPPQVISRDRAGAYAEAARRGAPRAMQVADRFHLLRNLREAVEHVVARHGSLIDQSFQQLAPVLSAPAPVVSPKQAITRSQQLSQERRQKRLRRYQQVIEMRQHGISRRGIAMQLGLNRKTVRHWLGAGQFPERQQTPRQSAVDSWADYLQRRWEEGCHNRSQLWRELRAQGADIAAVTLRRWFRIRLGVHGRIHVGLPLPPMKRPSARQISWLLLGLTKKITPTQQCFLEALSASSPDVAMSAELAKKFYRMLKKRDKSAWPSWLKAASKSPLRRFSVQLQRDAAAVVNGLTLPWSTGQVEGHIHRLKLIKRQMYGRAKFDLLRIRVLHAA